MRLRLRPNVNHFSAGIDVPNGVTSRSAVGNVESPRAQGDHTLLVFGKMR